MFGNLNYLSYNICRMENVGYFLWKFGIFTWNSPCEANTIAVHCLTNQCWNVLSIAALRHTANVTNSTPGGTRIRLRMRNNECRKVTAKLILWFFFVLKMKGGKREALKFNSNFFKYLFFKWEILIAIKRYSKMSANIVTTSNRCRLHRRFSSKCHEHNQRAKHSHRRFCIESKFCFDFLHRKASNCSISEW